MKLFHLTHDNLYSSSEHQPARLPENNYSYIEIIYSYETIFSVKSKYVYENNLLECILSDIAISSYVNKIKEIQVDYKFVTLTDDEIVKDLTLKTFITLLCSCLIYFHYLFPKIETCLEMLDLNVLDATLKLDINNNEVEDNWIQQIKYFFESFPIFDRIYEFNKVEEVLIEEETKTPFVTKEIETKEVNINTQILDFINNKIEEKLEEALSKIDHEADLIAQEIREYRRRLIDDLNKYQTLNNKTKMK